MDKIGIWIILIGILSIILKRYNYIIILISIEIIIIGVSLLILNYSIKYNNIEGITTTIYLLTLGAVESALGLSILIELTRLYRGK